MNFTYFHSLQQTPWHTYHHALQFPPCQVAVPEPAPEPTNGSPLCAGLSVQELLAIYKTKILVKKAKS